MQVPLLDLKAQYKTIQDEVKRAIDNVCESQAFALGPAVAQFERNVAAYCGVKHAIGVSSGTDALLASLMALGIKPGDEVITTPFTFFATAGSVVRLGAKPVFVDVDPDSFNIDPAKIEPQITEKTRAIIPVHLFGQVAQMKPILDMARRHNLVVIEDAAQAIGAVQDGVKAGNFGDCGCFSFYPTKNLGAFGDGGLVTTNNDGLAGQIRALRDHGQKPRYFYHVVGGNFRLDGIQGAVLDVKLKYLGQWNEKRRRHAALYDRFLSDSPVKTPRINANNRCIYHQYTIVAPERDKLQQFLADNGIGSAIFYPKPLHLQDCFSDLGYSQGDMPVAERLCGEVLSLPIYAELTPEQIEYVARTILEFYEKNEDEIRC
ncbi:MAG: DegT/DnrJ/EryC1/StrS family aminotransferase [Sedimentisphaerales bacterium]|nr:DegT/DnrJ/EryC1/StrS family aminotransferase [Sedimentisphaerales bacterium]